MKKNLLQQSSKSFFFVFNWDKTINNNPKKKLFIIFLYNNNKLVSIFPFYINNFLTIKTLEWIGEPFNDLNFPNFLSDHNFINNNVGEVINKILVENKKQFEFVYLKKQINFFNKDLFFNSLVSHTTREENKVAILYKNFEKYISENSFFRSSRFKKLKKDIDKFQIIYKSSFSLDDKDKFKKEVFNFFLKNKSYKIQKTGKWDYTKHSKYVEFINLNLYDKHCICNAIYLNNQIISANIGFIDKETYYYIFPCYDYKWAKISPGRINLYLLIEELFGNKLCKRFDFTIGNEAYKDLWSNKKEYLIELYFINSFKGNILMILIKFKNLINNTKFFKIIKYFYNKIRK